MPAKANVLEFIFSLNQAVAEREGTMQPVIGLGLPAVVEDLSEFLSTDCIPPQHWCGRASVPTTRTQRLNFLLPSIRILIEMAFTKNSGRAP